MSEWTQGALLQTLTWWRATGHDDTGKPTFAAPVHIKGRWEAHTRRFADDQGELRAARAGVRVDRDIASQDWLAQGAQTALDPTAVSGAWQVQEFQKVPDWDGTSYDRVALL